MKVLKALKILAYIEKDGLPAKLNLGEAARQANVSTQRFRRALMFLQIPIERSGSILLIDRSAIAKVKKALTDGTIQRGRPRGKKEAPAIG